MMYKKKDLFVKSQITVLYSTTKLGRSIVLPNTEWDDKYKNIHCVANSIVPESKRDGIKFTRKYSRQTDCVIVPRNLQYRGSLTSHAVDVLIDIINKKIPAVWYMSYYLSEKKLEDLTYEKLTNIIDMCISNDSETMQLGMNILLEYSCKKYLAIQAYIYKFIIESIMINNIRIPKSYILSAFFHNKPNGYNIMQYASMLSSDLDINLHQRIFEYMTKKKIYA